MVAHDGSPAAAAPRWRTLILLASACLLVYNANLRLLGTGDSLPARYLPLGIWRHGTVALDPIATLVAHGHPSSATWTRSPGPAEAARIFQPFAYWMVRTRHHHLVSLYPVVTPLLVAPLYLPALGYLRLRGWEAFRVDDAAIVTEKLSASIVATIAVLLVYLLLRREAGRWSLPLALAFAFATNTWAISSQALWQHGMGELLLALALLLVTGAPSPSRAAALGAVCALCAANRPPDVLLAGALVLAAWWARGWSARWLAAGAALPAIGVLAYNLKLVGSIAGGYGTVQHTSLFESSAWAGIAGLLVSPARGLLVFTPFLAFVPLGWRRRLRAPETRPLALALGIGVAAQIGLYALVDWRGGSSWGPRWLTDMLPVLLWMLAPAPAALRPLGRALLVAAIAVSAAVQGIGAFWYIGTSDEPLYASADWMRAAWRFDQIPFVTELRHPPASRDLLCGPWGYIDRIGTTRLTSAAPAVAPAIGAGTPVEGWALRCGHSVTRLLLLVDGIVIGETDQFLARSDVSAALHTSAPAGWSILADPHGLRPGLRLLEVAVRAAPTSEFRILARQEVTVVAAAEPPPAAPAGGEPRAPDLAALAAEASSRLRADQSAAGYWLTAHTTGERFVDPHAEMNTFMTALLVDLVSPVARRHALDDVLERARRHLGAQIEGDGLVRYHGLPDGPTIGTLGCRITPDADDTALAWRIAGPGRADPRRAPMLRTLGRYRDARGLYRTWLAPRDRFECLDPGRDPDPVDATIQMHVYLMLREQDPPAARSLCRALGDAAGDDALWVYYARAPLVPFLRSAELRQRGCALPVGPALLARTVPGQEAWSAAARLLVAVSSSPATASEREAIVDLLARLGRDGFAELRRNPPLLYHNDLTAHVRRFYWSADVGYALWLRLYDAVERDAAATRPASGPPPGGVATAPAAARSPSRVAAAGRISALGPAAAGLRTR